MTLPLRFPWKPNWDRRNRRLFKVIRAQERGDKDSKERELFLPLITETRGSISNTTLGPQAGSSGGGACAPPPRPPPPPAGSAGAAQDQAGEGLAPRSPSGNRWHLPTRRLRDLSDRGARGRHSLWSWGQGEGKVTCPGRAGAQACVRDAASQPELAEDAPLPPPRASLGRAGAPSAGDSPRKRPFSGSPPYCSPLPGHGPEERTPGEAFVPDTAAKTTPESRRGPERSEEVGPAREAGTRPSPSALRPPAALSAPPDHGPRASRAPARVLPSGRAARPPREEPGAEPAPPRPPAEAALPAGAEQRASRRRRTEAAG
ncbi:uncharacterized protein LOC115804203 [Delphinapterus leucas]|uniref:Uncharacterized protein LOC115804203 n=1 Tax=Delphinapterus leucas TaxID=9749 RepID=A0A7F8KC35_DELLE|nr:uncharacterized protein LOC115804203 [Delphinapterus leucas]